MMENNLFSKTFLSTHNHSNFIILSWPHFKSFWSENWVPRLIFDEEHDAEVRKLLSLLVLAVQKNRIQRLTSHPHPNPNYSINYYTLPLLFLQKSWVVKKFLKNFDKKIRKFFFSGLKFCRDIEKFAKFLKNFANLFLKIDPKPIYFGRISQYKHHPRKNFTRKLFFSLKSDIPAFYRQFRMNIK